MAGLITNSMTADSFGYADLGGGWAGKRGSSKPGSGRSQPLTVGPGGGRSERQHAQGWTADSPHRGDGWP